MPTVSIEYSAPPTLGRFLASNAFVRAVVGPIGSGKSSACVMEILARAVEQKPTPVDKVRRTRFAVIRNTYGQLRDTTRKTFEQWVPQQLGTWNEQQLSFTMDFPLGDGTRVHSEVLFRALDRPGDVGKVLSLELTGAYLNEAREIPKEIFDILQGRVGRYPSKREGGPTWFGVWLDTNPWATSHWGFETFNARTPPEGHEVFEQPGGLGPDAENADNLPPGYYARLCAGKDTEWIDEYVNGLYPKRDRGSIYGDLVSAVLERGGLSDFQHAHDGVFVTHDLGISDSTAQWYWRINGDGGIDLVDHYEASGKPISHFFDEMEKRPYQYVKYFLPHDARARTLVTGTSVLDRFLERYPGKVAMVPELSVEDGIQAARWLLEKPVRFHARCEQGVRLLRAYRYAFDEDKKVFSRKPVHDFTSHTADSFRYVAVSAKTTELLMRKPLEVPKPVARPIHYSFSLDELFEDNVNSRGGRERI